MKLKSARELGVVGADGSGGSGGSGGPSPVGGGCMMLFGSIFVCSGLVALGAVVQTGEAAAIAIGGLVGCAHLGAGLFVVYAGWRTWQGQPVVRRKG